MHAQLQGLVCPCLPSCRSMCLRPRHARSTQPPLQCLGIAQQQHRDPRPLTHAGKGNLKDGLSRVLTELSQGYLQPDVGGKNIPVSQGELSDLVGDEPLFKALYKW